MYHSTQILNIQYINQIFTKNLNVHFISFNITTFHFDSEKNILDYVHQLYKML